MEPTLSVYVIKCANDKYYVGSSNRPLSDRILEHFAANGSGWTRIHQPVDLIAVVENADRFDEDKYTKIYMEKYGVDNVRGGSYVQIRLHDFQIKSLELEFATALGACFNCGKPGHYANACDASPVIETSKIMKSFVKKKAVKKCKRCGRDHGTANCYAEYHADGTMLPCMRCGRDHVTSGCYASKDINGKFIRK